MSRDIPFDPLAICNICGEIGAYDFNGDNLCPRCIAELDNDYSNDPIESDDDE